MTRAELRTAGMLAAGFATAYSLFGLLQHWSFQTSIDLAIFDQAAWHLSRFERPASSVLGLSNVLGDHFYPLLAIYGLLYRIAPAPETLIVSQALLLAASVIPVFVFLRSRLAQGPTVALCVAYGLFWAMQRTMKQDFHEMAFAPLLLASVVLAMDRRRWGWFWSACVLLAMVKEDLVPVLTGLGLYLVVIQGERTRGSVLIGASLVVFAVIVGYVIPEMNDAGSYRYAGAYQETIREWWRLPLTMFMPTIKMEALFYWFAPFLFLSWRSPIALLLIPIAVERLLSTNPAHWGTTFHHSAPIAPLVVMSAGDGLARLTFGWDTARIRTWLPRITAFIALAASLLPGAQPLWLLFSPSFYAKVGASSIGARALAEVPRDASVVAQGALLPHLSHRAELYALGPAATDAAYVIAAEGLTPWPAATREELLGLVTQRRERGYVTVFEESGWIVLKRP